MLRCSKVSASCFGRAHQGDPTLNALGSTVLRLLRERRGRAAAYDAVQRQPAAAMLEERVEFGSNPGALRMLWRPASAGAPLVVALHGCTQNAAGYVHGTGWLDLAAAAGFALLAPEQRPDNNRLGCFNWFEPPDTRRGSGEVQSIRQMIAHLVTAEAVDPRRIFVTGLSAGGAMTAALLATYPDVFAAGAIIAGLPYEAAGSMQAAYAAMGGRGAVPPRGWAHAVRAASRHDGPWPRVAIWHGSADTTVQAANADALVEQWRGVHGLDARPDSEAQVAGHTHRVWRGADGAPRVEAWRIAGMAHGVPVDSAGGWGAAGPYFLEAGISSTWHIAQSWGLTGNCPERRTSARPSAAQPAAHATDPASVIDRALRAAGLR
jgi:feruloyl esterase